MLRKGLRWLLPYRPLRGRPLRARSLCGQATLLPWNPSRLNSDLHPQVLHPQVLRAPIPLRQRHSPQPLRVHHPQIHAILIRSLRSIQRREKEN